MSPIGGNNAASELITCQSISNKIFIVFEPGTCFIISDMPQERSDASNEKMHRETLLSDFIFMLYRDKMFKLEIVLSLQIYMYCVTHIVCKGTYEGKTIYHLSLRVSRLQPRCYLAGF